MAMLWHIVPVNDGFTYLCIDENKNYILKEKAKESISNDKLIFDTQEKAQDFINSNLDVKAYRTERFWIKDKR